MTPWPPDLAWTVFAICGAILVVWGLVWVCVHADDNELAYFLSRCLWRVFFGLLCCGLAFAVYSLLRARR